MRATLDGDGGDDDEDADDDNDDGDNDNNHSHHEDNDDDGGGDTPGHSVSSASRHRHTHRGSITPRVSTHHRNASSQASAGGGDGVVKPRVGSDSARACVRLALVPTHTQLAFRHEEGLLGDDDDGTDDVELGGTGGDAVGALGEVDIAALRSKVAAQLLTPQPPPPRSLGGHAVAAGRAGVSISPREQRVPLAKRYQRR